MDLRKYGVAILLASTAVACAPKPLLLPPPPPPLYVPVPKPPPLVLPPRPVRPFAPGNAAVTLVLPPRGGNGNFKTLNSGVTGERAFWQMKIGLNVAAIGCRGDEEATLVPAYNRVIKAHQKTIRETEKTVIAELRKVGRVGRTSAIAARDQLATKLFNYFAQPPAQAAFCAKANILVQQIADSSASTLIENAAAHLEELNEPFVSFYEAYDRYKEADDRYKRELAEWNVRYAVRNDGQNDTRYSLRNDEQYNLQSGPQNMSRFTFVEEGDILSGSTLSRGEIDREPPGSLASGGNRR